MALRRVVPIVRVEALLFWKVSLAHEFFTERGVSEVGKADEFATGHANDFVEDEGDDRLQGL